MRIHPGPTSRSVPRRTIRLNSSSPKNGQRLRLQLSVDGAFQRFAARLEISDLQLGTVSTRQQAVRAALERRLTVLDSFLTGSYRRHTMIGPLARADIDLFCVLHPGYHHPAGQSALLEVVRKALRETYPRTPEIRPNGQAVTIRFTDFAVDVVPGFHRVGGGFLIPSATERRWIETDPKAQETFIARANAAHDGKLIPLVKMVKAWNRNSGSRLHSFYLELMVESALRGKRIVNYPAALAYVFDRSRETVHWKATDPGCLDSGKVNSLARGNLPDAVAALDLAYRRSLEGLRLQGTGQTREARGRWRQVLGEPFPGS